jgi:hypothetical protein
MTLLSGKGFIPMAAKGLDSYEKPIGHNSFRTSMDMPYIGFIYRIQIKLVQKNF